MPMEKEALKLSDLDIVNALGGLPENKMHLPCAVNITAEQRNLRSCHQIVRAMKNKNRKE